MIARFQAALLVLLFSSGYLQCTAQDAAFLFNHLKEKDGLSNNIINCFLKDSRGIFWIGTFDGLNRYDGAHFYTFKRTKDSTSMTDNVVHSLCEDKEGNIWGGTDNGIFCYQVKSGKFRNYPTPNNKVTRAVMNITCDKEGIIWASGTWTFLQYKPATGSFEEIGPLTRHPDSLNYYAVRKNGLVADPSGRGLWLATGRGLHYYDKKTGQFSHFKNQPDNPLFAGVSVSALSIGPRGYMWYFDNNHKRITEFDPRNRRITRQIDIAAEMPQASGATLFEDRYGRIWFSSWTAEIAVIESRDTVRFRRVKHNPHDALSIAGDFFWGGTEDEDGTIWLGTVGGISKCNPSRTLYQVLHLPDKIPSLQNDPIQVIREDPADQSWWIATSGWTVIHYFPATGEAELLDKRDIRPTAAGVYPGDIKNIRFLDRKIIFCTERGSWEWAPGRRQILPFTFLPASYSSFVIRDIVRDGNLFYITNGKEILQWDREKGKVTPAGYSSAILPDGQRAGAGTLTFKPGQGLWVVAAFGWLASLDDSSRLKPVKIISDDSREQNGYFNSVDMDKEGRIWLANKGVGLYSYYPATHSVKYWDETDGLISNHIQRAIADQEGQIWCMAANKFSVFVPGTGNFYNFSLPLSENNINYSNSTALLSNGNILASIYNDIIVFYPQRLGIRPQVRKPEISVIGIAGREKLLTTEESLQLEPDENSLILKFGLLTDPGLFPYSFQYRLEGFDEQWIPASASNEAVYNNLPPGKYTFRLLAKAKNNSWQSAERTLGLSIRTPFYQAAWFYLLVIGLLITLVYALYRYRLLKQRQVHALHSKAQSLEKEKAMVMYENLKQHLNPHFLFNSLTSLSSLIRLDQQMAGDFLDKMSKVYRYILRNRDNETVALGDEIRFVNMYIQLQKTRFEESLQVSMDIDEEYHHRKIAPVTLQNLVENAIKHNIADSSQPLVIELYVEDDFLVVRNNLQRKSFVETSNKQGLSNMESLYRYLGSRPMIIEENGVYFTVKIPLL